MLTSTQLLVIWTILDAHPTVVPELVAAVWAEFERVYALEQAEAVPEP